MSTGYQTITLHEGIIINKKLWNILNNCTKPLYVKFEGSFHFDGLEQSLELPTPLLVYRFKDTDVLRSHYVLDPESDQPYSYLIILHENYTIETSVIRA